MAPTCASHARIFRQRGSTCATSAKPPPRCLQCKAIPTGTSKSPSDLNAPNFKRLFHIKKAEFDIGLQKCTTGIGEIAVAQQRRQMSNDKLHPQHKEAETTVSPLAFSETFIEPKCEIVHRAVAETHCSTSREVGPMRADRLG